MAETRVSDLCVPWADLTLRKAAIRSMQKVYERASKVLVLDNYIQESTYNSPWEAIITISCSTWVRRLWTYQEAILPQSSKVNFLFRDRLACIDTLMLEWIAKTPRDKILFCPVITDALGLYTLFGSL